MCKVSKETWRKLDDEEEKCDKWIREIKRVRDEQVRMYFLFCNVKQTYHCLFYNHFVYMAILLIQCCVLVARSCHLKITYESLGCDWSILWC